MPRYWEGRLCMSEFQIIEIKPGSVTTNFADIKAELSRQLDIYRNVEVTEDTLPVCRDVKKTLRGQSRDIDTFRKTVKRELTAPITEFENKCKELQALIDEVVSPIDEGIREFDEKTRQEKIERAKALIDEIAKKMDFEHTDRIEIKDSWGNVSTTKKAIKEDITAQIQMVNEALRERDTLIATIRTLVDMENASHDYKMDAERFIPLVDEGMAMPDIVTEIKKASELISNAEKGQKDKQVEKDETERTATKNEPNNGYLIRILDNPSTAQDVVSVLADHGYFARVEE